MTIVLSARRKNIAKLFEANETRVAKVEMACWSKLFSPSLLRDHRWCDLNIKKHNLNIALFNYSSLLMLSIGNHVQFIENSKTVRHSFMHTAFRKQNNSRKHTKKQPHSKQQYARCLFACYSFQCDSVSVLKSNRLQYENFTFSSLVALCVRLWAVSKW